MHASIFVTDAILLEKAGLIATQLGVNNETFRKSNGWLNRFKTRHGIHQIELQLCFAAIHRVLKKSVYLLSVMQRHHDHFVEST